MKVTVYATVSERDAYAARKFNCTIRERAIFEAGIKLATIYHQFVGSPVSTKNVRFMEEAIERAVRIQPYVTDVKVKIDDSKFGKSDRYSYSSLTGEMIDAVVTVLVDDVAVTGEMRYDNNLKYPLMFVSKIECSTKI
ncbi:MAG: dihydroneopterin aldolase family protein [archaeon]|nr:dihydroneopterin aldolase family protein [archaeon]